MKTKLLILTITALGLFGCATTPFERGVLYGTGAKLIFDSPEDEAKFAEIKDVITKRLEDPTPITEQIILDYALKLKTDFSSAFYELVLARLRAELGNLEIPALGNGDPTILDDARVREVLSGIKAAL